MSSYLPPQKNLTLAMLGKPVQIYIRPHENAEKTSSTPVFNQTWSGTLEWFRMDHEGWFLAFHIVGDPHVFIVDMKKHEMEVTV